MKAVESRIRVRHNTRRFEKEKRPYTPDKTPEFDVRDLLFFTQSRAVSPIASLFSLSYIALFSKEKPVVNEVKDEAKKYFKKEHRAKIREMTEITSSDSIQSLMENSSLHIL